MKNEIWSSWFQTLIFTSALAYRSYQSITFSSACHSLHPHKNLHRCAICSLLRCLVTMQMFWLHMLILLFNREVQPVCVQRIFFFNFFFFLGGGGCWGTFMMVDNLIWFYLTGQIHPCVFSGLNPQSNVLVGFSCWIMRSDIMLTDFFF